MADTKQTPKNATATTGSAAVAKPKLTAEEKLADNKDRFSRVASGRLNNALKQIELLGNCFNPNQYSYNQEQIDTMFGHLTSAIKSLQAKASATVSKKDDNKIKL